jgi:enediyne biosynthesis protein E4
MQKGVRRIFLLIGSVWIAVLSISASCYGQGVATGGTAVPAKPLPAGMKPPTVRFEDVAAEAGLTGRNVSGAEQGQQYIVETTGTGVAIFDYDNDGLPDIFLVNADRLQKNQPGPTFSITILVDSSSKT